MLTEIAVFVPSCKNQRRLPQTETQQEVYICAECYITQNRRNGYGYALYP